MKSCVWRKEAMRRKWIGLFNSSISSARGFLMSAAKKTIVSEYNNENVCSRRDFLSAAVAVPIFLFRVGADAAIVREQFQIASPDGQIVFSLNSKPSRLTYRISLKNAPAIDTSNLGIIVDGTDLGAGAEITKVEPYRVNEQYAWRGVHSTAINNYRGTRFKAIDASAKTEFTVDVRVFNNGVAFRYIVPAKDDKQHVPDEATTFTLPVGSTTWFHDFTGHYEGVHVKKTIADVKDGEWAAPPLTAKLPDNVGYVAITEGALINYAGMGLRADGQRGFKGVLGHALPVSH